MLEINKVYFEDCLEGMKRIDDKSIDMILCDLPYGTTQCKWDTIISFEQLWNQYLRISKDNSSIILFASEPFTSLLIMSNLSMFKYRITWNKVTVTGHLNANKMPLQQVEDICVFYRKHPRYFPQFKEKSQENLKSFVAKFTGKEQNNNVYGNAKARKLSKNYDKRYPTNLICFPSKSAECNGRNRIHPTQKPIALFEYLIKTYTNENELILDNCMGSGTTAIACINTNRNYIGFENNKKYYDITIKRIEDRQLEP